MQDTSAQKLDKKQILYIGKNWDIKQIFITRACGFLLVSFQFSGVTHTRTVDSFLNDASLPRASSSSSVVVLYICIQIFS